MREYGQVQSAFWQSKDAEGFSDGAKLLAVYLLTCPHANGIGAYRLPDGYVSGDLGWDSETVSKRFDELFEKGFAYRFDGVVFLPNFLRWNKINNGNIATARFNEWDVLPKGEAKTLAARAMLEFCNHWADGQKRLLERVTQTIPQTVTQPEPNPTQPNPERTQPKGAQKSAQGKLTLPDWLPADAWKDWHDYRNSRKGWTRKAKELSLNTLGELREKGHDPTKVICQSIERGWSGLFPLKDGVDTGSRPRLKEL